jgi:hypothetical protein
MNKDNKMSVEDRINAFKEMPKKLELNKEYKILDAHYDRIYALLKDYPGFVEMVRLDENNFYKETNEILDRANDNYVIKKIISKWKPIYDRVVKMKAFL